MNIHDSLNMILTGGSKFAEGFYYRFELEHPDISRHFAGLNMKLLAHMLTTSLLLVVNDFENPSESIKVYLRVLGTRHHHRHIEKADYAAWQNTLVASLAEFHGDQWTVELATQWNSALKMAIEQMLLGYDQSYHV